MIQNAEFDHFNPQQHTLEWAKSKRQLKSPDLWLLSKLQETVETYTERLETCQFNFALASLEDFAIECLSRLYVPMVRKELWSDDPNTQERRLAVYAVLWNALKTITLLFNPITPYLCEALYQKVYKRLDDSLLESVNFEDWPKPDKKLRNEDLETQFQLLFKTVSLAYAARQTAKLKRRWPLSKMIVVAPKDLSTSLKGVEELLLELANVKSIEFSEKPIESPGFATASEDETQVYVSTTRDDKLLGEGLMRDVARRIQALRRELGYSPTDLLDIVYVSDLDQESVSLLTPYLNLMAELVRSKKVSICGTRQEINKEWHDCQLDDKRVGIAIVKEC